MSSLEGKIGRWRKEEGNMGVMGGREEVGAGDDLLGGDEHGKGLCWALVEEDEGCVDGSD